MRFPRRRRILIDRLQYRLLGVNLFHSCVVVLVFAALLFGPLIRDLLLGNLSPNEQDQAATAFLTLHYRVWLPVIVALLCLIIHSLIVSHRIAGPLYQFRTLFTRMKEGDLTVRARLRRGDYLASEAQIINEMSASLERRFVEMQRNGLDLCAGLDSLKRELAAERPTAAVLTLIEILDSRADRFRQLIVELKTAPEEDYAEEHTTRDAPPGSVSTPSLGGISAGTG